MNVEPLFSYSVVIPFKGNVEMLESALRSIPDRDDIQVLVADDNYDFVEFDSPFKLAAFEHFVVDEHRGAGHARNLALQKVKGRFILFCDSDDWFAQGAFDVFDRCLDTGNDITFFNVASVRLFGFGPAFRHLRKRLYLRRYLRCGNEDGLRYRWDAPWGKLYKATYVLDGGYVFGETPVSNDDLFSVHTGHNAGKIGVDVQQPVYVCTSRSGSLTSDKSRGTCLTNYRVHLEKLDYLRSIGRPDLCRRLWMHKLRLFLRCGPIKKCL